MRSRIWKRLTAVLLAAVLCFSMAGTAFAADLPFTDVQKRDWYYSAVQYVYGTNLMVGISDSEFRPNDTLTREMFVTILGRLAGVEEDAYTEVSFSDVEPGEWYTPYVAWAAEYGITVGNGGGTFGVEESVTREEMAVFVSRYLNTFGCTVPDASEPAGAFTDAETISWWAEDAVEQMRMSGLFVGKDDGGFHPRDTATRAEAATLFMRLGQALGLIYEDTDDEDASNLAVPSKNGALSVKGTQLTDSSGNAVQLRGVSTHGLSWYPQYVNQACFDDLKSWGANVVRLAMYTAEYNGYCTGGSSNQESLKALIRQGVEYASNADMYVIIDWHILSDGNPNTYRSEAVSFFSEMSKEFADYDNVLYEICNEPNGGTDWATIKSYAETIIPVIRANDPDAVIIVGTPTWSQEVDKAAADPITGYSNIMYSLHFYAATHQASLRNTMVNAVEAGLPIFVTEFGICDASGSGAIDTASANAWVSTMDAYGISYVAWNLSNKEETSAILRADVTKTSGFTRDDLSESGKWLYDLLTSESGSTPSAGSPADTGGSGDAGSSGSAEQGDGLSVQLVNSWESDGSTFFQYTVSLQNTTLSDMDSWEITIPFSSAFTLHDNWNGSYSVDGNTLTIQPLSYNSYLPAGGEVRDIGFIVSGGNTLTILS